MKRGLIVASVAVLVLAIVVEFALGVYDSNVKEWWLRIPAFYAVYGFVGCGLIVVVSKALGHWLLERKEDYYD